MEEQKDKTLSNPEVVQKYRQCSEIVNQVLSTVIQNCVPGADVAEICSNGDFLIEDGLRNIEPNTSVEKGIAIPVCLNINNICSYFSPSTEASTTLQEGDLVKVDLGAHLDGYIVTAASSIVVRSDASQPVDDRRADAISAAYNALQAGLRTIKVGNTNTQVTEVMNKATEPFQCNMLEGLLSHQLKHHVIDGNQVIIGKETYDQRVEEFEFEENQAYALDVIVSTGEGKPRESENRPTVFKRALETVYNLKLKGSRQFLAEVNQRFPTLLFTLRAFSNQRNARMGVSECLKHDLIIGYPVLEERRGTVVAQFKATILLLPEGPQVLNVLPYNADQYRSQHTIEDQELQTLLSTPL